MTNEQFFSKLDSQCRCPSFLGKLQLYLYVLFSKKERADELHKLLKERNKQDEDEMLEKIKKMTADLQKLLKDIEARQ